MRIYSQRKGSFARSMARAIVKGMPKTKDIDDETARYVLKYFGIIALTLAFIFLIIALTI